MNLNIIEYNEHFNHYFKKKNITNSTVSYFKDSIKLKKTKNSSWFPVLVLDHIENESNLYLPINYNDISIHIHKENYLYKHLNDFAKITLIFDCPFEMFAYYQLHQHQVKEHYQFICFNKVATKQMLNKIISLCGNTKIVTVFLRSNRYSDINTIRLSLENKQKEYSFNKIANAYNVKIQEQEFILEEEELKLHIFEKITKTRYHIKTKRPPKKYNNYLEILKNESSRN